MILFNDPRCTELINAAAGAGPSPYDISISNLTHDGKLLGGVIYKQYTGASIHAHVASVSPKWLSKDMLWVIFHYPFIQLGVEKIFAPIPGDKKAALEFDRKLGFKEEVRISGVFPAGAEPGHDQLILMSMRREDCRWLSIKPSHLRGGGSNGR